jgi:hypothetical protein
LVTPRASALRHPRRRRKASADRLKLKLGDWVLVVIKASDVMAGK